MKLAKSDDEPVVHRPCLKTLLEEDVQSLLRPHDRTRVLERDRLVALGDAAHGLVEQVGDHEDAELRDRVGTAFGQPGDRVLPAGPPRVQADDYVERRQDRERNREPEHPRILTDAAGEANKP